MDIKDTLEFQLSNFKEEGLKEVITSKGQIVTVDSGSAILREGAYVKTVPILLNGLVKVVREEAGKEILLYYIYPLESCIVSIHCGMNQIKSRVKAIAEEESTALLLPSFEIDVWQKKYDSFNNFILNLYQKRFNDILDAFNELAFQKLDDRLFSYLKAKSKALNSNKIKMTHQDLADELGSARETISRILKKLEVEGKVKLQRSIVEIL